MLVNVQAVEIASSKPALSEEPFAHWVDAEQPNIQLLLLYHFPKTYEIFIRVPYVILVDFVRQDSQLLLVRQFHQVSQVLFAEHAAAGVIRVDYDYPFDILPRVSRLFDACLYVLDV